MDSNKPMAESEEISIQQIREKLNRSASGLVDFIFRIVFFIRRNIIPLAVVFLIGAAIGVFLDKTGKSYEHQIIVQPNFASNEYLYGKVELINAKIEERDTLFLKNVVGIKEPKKLSEISIKPITDVYKFIENKPQNFELIKLMADNGDIKKIIEEDVTSKNYPFHLLTFSTDKITTDEKTVTPILKFLNDSDYYKELQKVTISNIKVKMQKNDSIITQIDKFLDGVSTNIASGQKNDKLIYYNENTQLNDVIKTKDALISENGSHRLELIYDDKIIKDNSRVINIRKTKGVNGKMKFVIPILFVFLFMIGAFFRALYKKQLLKKAAI